MARLGNQLRLRAPFHEPQTLMEQHLLALAICRDPALRPSAVRVGIALLGFLNRKTGRCDPALETIGAQACMKRTATIDALSDLQRVGWIRMEKGGGRSRSNAYSFNFDRVKQSADADGIDNNTVRTSGPFDPARPLASAEIADEPKNGPGNRENSSDLSAKQSAVPYPNPKGNPEGNPVSYETASSVVVARRADAPPLPSDDDVRTMYGFVRGDLVSHRRFGPATVLAVHPPPRPGYSPTLEIRLADGDSTSTDGGLVDMVEQAA